MKGEYFNIEDQSKYHVVVSTPVNMEDLSDSFVTRDELLELTGNQLPYFGGGNGNRTVIFHAAIETALEEYTERLEVSDKRSLVIDNDELLEVLKLPQARHMTEYTNHKYCRHGNRLRYWESRRRKKTKATNGDAQKLWWTFYSAFRGKYGADLPAVPLYYRTAKLFNAYKKLIGWNAVRKHLAKSEIKFCRYVWDHPEEFMK